MMGRSSIRSVARSGLALVLLLITSLGGAQSTGCDEGVIRLPDRSGTIQICSALSAQVPQLTRQLAEALRLLGSQQQQLSQLTRLVTGLNSVGKNLERERQAQLLLSLNKELERSARRGDASARRDFETLIERLDDLQEQLRKAAASPAGQGELRAAMSGTLGESIARLEFGSALTQLEEMTKRLKAIEEGVAAVRQDTSAMRSDMSRLETRMIDALRDVASEIRALGNRGGMVEKPTSYAAVYHNSRILAQRGEFELAIQSYERLFGFPVQMADPISDLVTLTRRMYGLSGARNYFEQKLKGRIRQASYLYAQLLLVEPGREAEAQIFNWATPEVWIQAARDFPPVGVQVFKMHDVQKRHYLERSWKTWRFYEDLRLAVEKSINSGEFLAYFADQLRGGAAVDVYSQLALGPYFDDLFQFLMANPDMPHNSRESGRNSADSNRIIRDYRIIDLRSSPVVVDYTYTLEPPVYLNLTDRSGYYFEWVRYPNAPKRELGVLRLSIWDALIDKSKPVEVCAQQGNGTERCVNLNTSEYSCNGLPGMHMFSERYQCFTVAGRILGSIFHLPNADTTFSPLKWLGSSCVSRVAYRDGSGNAMSFRSSDIVSTHRWPNGRAGNSDLEAQMRKCGYLIQVKDAVPASQLRERPRGVF